MNIELSSLTPEQHDIVARVARVCHEANNAYRAALGEPGELPGWAEAPGWQRDSVTEGVLHTALNPLAGPEESHERWLQHKLKQGWKHGPVKDAAARRHPCMVPYEMLPEEQRRKDMIFQGIVRAFLPALARVLPVPDVVPAGAAHAALARAEMHRQPLGPDALAMSAVFPGGCTVTATAVHGKTRDFHELEMTDDCMGSIGAQVRLMEAYRLGRMLHGI